MPTGLALTGEQPQIAGSGLKVAMNSLKTCAAPLRLVHSVAAGLKWASGDWPERP
jgi:hypothetical protein